MLRKVNERTERNCKRLRSQYLVVVLVVVVMMLILLMIFHNMNFHSEGEVLREGFRERGAGNNVLN